MKQKIAIIMAALLLAASFTACGGGNEPSVSTPESSQTQSADESTASSESEESSVMDNESSEVSTPESINRTWPCVSGTFMQPGSFTSFTVDNWKNHFKYLLEVGIDIFIIQWTSETPYGKIKSIYYPSALTDGKKADGFYESPDLLPRVLEAAEETGMKVYVGLNLSDEWWNIVCTDDSWNKMQSDLGMDMANEIYSLYKEKYPNALYGWYFAWEMFNGMSNHETQAGEFLNMYLDRMTELDPTMPMLLSPFINQDRSTAEKAGAEWKKVFETSRFREGDIFCCQDAIGAKFVQIENLDKYFAALKEAVNTEPGLKFWANNEDFDGGESAFVNRFVKQMEISSRYVEGHVTFAYSHYYAKDYNGKGGFHNAYKYYYDNGTIPEEIEKPELSYELKSGKVSFEMICRNSGAGLLKVVGSIDGREDYVKEIPITMSSKEKLTYHYIITPREGEKEITLNVSVYDYFGNEATETITATIG